MKDTRAPMTVMYGSSRPPSPWTDIPLLVLFSPVLLLMLVMCLPVLFGHLFIWLVDPTFYGCKPWRIKERS